MYRNTTNVEGSTVEFLSRVNATSHKLALVGSPIPETEIIDVIMENVDRHYKDKVIREAFMALWLHTWANMLQP
ncbi:hypothetical protein C1H46_003435 [Malus baccata]|uniref:Uncharacterized protein n=1 Tax=Malus baccata TaxID=106549 RepID=A0A540NKJ5_MALBA|nr:hypothetical protein C1H46_003435 [Malus baccata]